MRKNHPPHDECDDGNLVTKDDSSRRLDALKAIRESAGFRWDKRRSYEWQLSLSIWTAAAAFSGIMLDKAYPIPDDRKVMIFYFVLGFASVIAISHGLFVYFMVRQTMADVSLQRWCEEKIYYEVFGKRLTVEDEVIPWERPFHPRMNPFRYIQIFITVIIMTSCVFSVWAPKPHKNDAVQTTTTNQTGAQK